MTRIRKSVKWERSDSSGSSGSNTPVEVLRFKPTQSLQSRTSTYSGRTIGHKPLPKSHVKTKRSSLTLGFVYLRRRLCCRRYFCTEVESDSDTSSDYNDDINALCTSKKTTEDEIIARLQQAVNELGYSPTSFDIESEVWRWEHDLEHEEKVYESSGKPAFKYNWFRRNLYLRIRKHPLYATRYENHRKLETRVEEFRFGVTAAEDSKGDLNEMRTKHSFLAHAHLNYYEELMNFGSGYWSNDKHIWLANLALIISANSFIQFPQICYTQGGFSFLCTYYFLLALVGQPLLYFEMILGQFSMNGPAGFGRLHKWAGGIPYAIGFVYVVFGTSKNALIFYSSLYFIVGFFWPTGKCGYWSRQQSKCFPYEKLEEDKERLQMERAHVNFTHGESESSIFSVDLYFREVMLDVNWKDKDYQGIFHWKLFFSFCFVFGYCFFMLQNSITGKKILKFLKLTRIIPVMLIVLLVHQAIIRGAFGYALSYFVLIDMEHVYVLSIWGRAFEMVLSTLGIGYGYHWSVSGKVRVDYRNAYRISWHICGYCALFALLSSLVVYCEIGIVGKLITGDPNQYLVFMERLGISFVCYSGALIKLGLNSGVFVVIFFMLLTLFGMWSQFLVLEMLFRWIDQGYIIKGHSDHDLHNKSTTVTCVILIQTFILLPHLFKLGAPVLATDNIFDGYFASYAVLLAELFTIVYLYGFARFLVDVEIMTKVPLPTLFQVQIRYIVMPTILLFMALMLADAFLEPQLYTDRKDIGLVFYIGLLANFIPVFIILLYPQFHWMRRYKSPTNKVHPEPFRYTRTVGERAPLYEQRFIAKKNAYSQSRGKSTRSQMYESMNEDMKIIFEAQQEVKIRFKELTQFKRNQIRWLRLLLGVLAQMKITTFYGLSERIMLHRRLSNDKVDLRFLHKTVDQFIHLLFYAAQRKISEASKSALYVHLGDELINSTTFHGEEFAVESDSDSDESSSASSDSSDDFHPSLSLHEMEELSLKYYQLHRKILGKLDKSMEENRALLEIRVKRALDIPYENEMNVLAFLRRMRARKEREQALWDAHQSIPIDHFVPASISHHGKKVAYTIFHAVVLEGNDHFVLKRLPIPRPTIVRVTRKFVNSQPGNTLMDKFAHVVTKRMLKDARELMTLRNLKDMKNEDIRKHLKKVTDMIDEDVYTFLDPLLTCVIVLVREEELKEVKKKFYLVPPTRRQEVWHTSRRKRNSHSKRRKSEDNNGSDEDFQMETYKPFTHKELQDAKWNNLLDSAPDIIFHKYSDDADWEVWDAADIKSSSGSESSVSPDDLSSVASAHSSILSLTSKGIGAPAGKMTGIVKSGYLLRNETLQKKDRRSLRAPKRSEDVHFQDSDLLRVDVSKIKHLSVRRWTRLHPRESPETFTTTEERLQKVIDLEAKRRANMPVTLTKSQNFLDAYSRVDMSRAINLNQIRKVIEDDQEIQRVDEEQAHVAPTMDDETVKTVVVEEKLDNRKQELLYIPIGKMLIVDHAVHIHRLKSRAPALAPGRTSAATYRY